MTTWIRLDPHEMATAGVQLRDLGLILDASSTRLRSTCCAAGLGRHGGPLTREGEVVAAQVVRLAEDYLRQAIDILQRTIAAVREGALVSSVATGGTVIKGGVVGAAPAAAGSNVWRPVARAQALEWARKGWIPQSWVAPQISGSGPSATATTAAMQNAAAVTRQQMSQLNAISGVGNPWTGYSKIGLTNYEAKFGSSFMGKSVKERFG